MFLAGSQKSKIQELESKIERLKLELARNNVDGFLREYFASDAMTDGDSNVFSELKRRLEYVTTFDVVRGVKLKCRSISEGKVSDLEQLLRSFENTTRDIREKQEILLSESELRSELEKVKSELASVNPEATKAVAELEIKIDFYQKSEVRLVQEIESLSAAWTDLETQNQSKVFNLAEKEEQILKLITERTKFDQKCEKLTRERNMINNQVIALKRQSERQLEQIRRLEERERLFTGQLNSLEKDLATKTVAADMHRKKVTELNQKQLELMDKLEKMHAKFTE
ncbi:E3 ubiquitin-protein ligase bre1, partial [Rhizoclosmatium hyalinum]